MKWPERVQTIVETLAGSKDWYSASDEERRTQTRRIAEQCRFEFGPTWGHKRADPGRPPSADVFCIKEGSIFEGWDWSVPEGVAYFPDSIDLTGQVFIEVDPINHLDVEPGPTPPPDEDDQDAINRDIYNRLEVIESRILADEEVIRQVFDEIGQRLTALEQQVALLVEELSKPLTVSGQTGRTALHSHSFSAEVKRG